jgi:hypothetical protein
MIAVTGLTSPESGIDKGYEQRAYLVYPKELTRQKVYLNGFLDGALATLIFSRIALPLKSTKQRPRSPSAESISCYIEAVRIIWEIGDIFRPSVV